MALHGSNLINKFLDRWRSWVNILTESTCDDQKRFAGLSLWIRAIESNRGRAWIRHI